MILTTIFAISGAWVGLSLAFAAVFCCFVVLKPRLECGWRRQDKSREDKIDG